jgi:hypothetical protein
MGLLMVVSPALAAQANLLENEKAFKQSRYWRRVARIGVVGSAVIGDCTLTLWFGKRQIAVLEPTTVGATVWPLDDDMIPISEPALCPPLTDMILETTLATTNVLRVILETQELPEMGMDARFPRFKGRRGTFRRRY